MNTKQLKIQITTVKKSVFVIFCYMAPLRISLRQNLDIVMLISVITCACLLFEVLEYRKPF